jgi:hypothetical protein
VVCDPLPGLRGCLFGLPSSFWTVEAAGFENEIPEHKKPLEAHGTQEARKWRKMSFGELSSEIMRTATTN